MSIEIYENEFLIETKNLYKISHNEKEELCKMKDAEYSCSVHIQHPYKKYKFNQNQNTRKNLNVIS